MFNYFISLEGRLYSMQMKKPIITSVKSNGTFNISGLTDHTDDMNQRIARKININQKKIALGIKRAQVMQTK